MEAWEGQGAASAAQPTATNGAKLEQACVGAHPCLARLCPGLKTLVTPQPLVQQVQAVHVEALLVLQGGVRD